MSYQRDQNLSETIAQARPAGAAPPALTQPYGNQAAQEALVDRTKEPIDITAIDDSEGGFGAPDNDLYWSAVFDSGEVPFTNVASMVDGILAQAGDRPIGTLRIEAHSESGVMYAGIKGGDIVSRYSFLDFAPQFSRLAGHFAPDGRVEIHGCNFAEFGGGEALLAEFSKLWGVPVTAPRQLQLALIPGMEGSTVTVMPDGKGGTQLVEQPSAMDGVMRGVEDFNHGWNQAWNALPSWSELVTSSEEALNRWIYGDEEEEQVQ